MWCSTPHVTVVYTIARTVLYGSDVISCTQKCFDEGGHQKASSNRRHVLRSTHRNAVRPRRTRRPQHDAHRCRNRDLRRHGGCAFDVERQHVLSQTKLDRTQRTHFYGTVYYVFEPPLGDGDGARPHASTMTTGCGARAKTRATQYCVRHLLPCATASSGDGERVAIALQR